MKLPDTVVQKFLEPRLYRKDREFNWKIWFAWRPVRLKMGDWRWFEYVARRRFITNSGVLYWEYLEPTPNVLAFHFASLARGWPL